MSAAERLEQQRLARLAAVEGRGAGPSFAPPARAQPPIVPAGIGGRGPPIQRDVPPHLAAAKPREEPSASAPPLRRWGRAEGPIDPVPAPAPAPVSDRFAAPSASRLDSDRYARAGGRASRSSDVAAAPPNRFSAPSGPPVSAHGANTVPVGAAGGGWGDRARTAREKAEREAEEERRREEERAERKLREEVEKRRAEEREIEAERERRQLQEEEDRERDREAERKRRRREEEDRERELEAERKRRRQEEEDAKLEAQRLQAIEDERTARERAAASAYASRARPRPCSRSRSPPPPPPSAGGRRPLSPPRIAIRDRERRPLSPPAPVNRYPARRSPSPPPPTRRGRSPSPQPILRIAGVSGSTPPGSRRAPASPPRRGPSPGPRGRSPSPGRNRSAGGSFHRSRSPNQPVHLSIRGARSPQRYGPPPSFDASRSVLDKSPLHFRGKFRDPEADAQDAGPPTLLIRTAGPPQPFQSSGPPAESSASPAGGATPSQGRSAPTPSPGGDDLGGGRPGRRRGSGRNGGMSEELNGPPTPRGQSDRAESPASSRQVSFARSRSLIPHEI